MSLSHWKHDVRPIQNFALSNLSSFFHLVGGPDLSRASVHHGYSGDLRGPSEQPLLGHRVPQPHGQCHRRYRYSVGVVFFCFSFLLLLSLFCIIRIYFMPGCVEQRQKRVTFSRKSYRTFISVLSAGPVIEIVTKKRLIDLDTPTAAETNKRAKTAATANAAAAAVPAVSKRRAVNANQLVKQETDDGIPVELRMLMGASSTTSTTSSAASAVSVNEASAGEVKKVTMPGKH